MCLLGKHEFGMRIMAFVTFCRLRTGDLRLIARTVLSKIFLENLHLHACEVLKGRRAVVLTTLPRLMVEGFLKEYLEVGEVVGAELQVVKGCCFTGVISWPDKQRALRDMVKAGAAIVNLSNVHHHQLSAKEIYVVREEESRSESSKMPRNKYPKPLVFHDGRLAFLPTPCEMMAFFMWIPVAIPLAVFRIAMGIVFPYKISIFIVAVTGIRFRRAGDGKANGEKKGVVYVCTHRTLLDPVMLCSALERTVPAVTYCAADPGQGTRRGDDAAAAGGGGGPGGVPGGDDVPGAVPAAVQPAVRGGGGGDVIDDNIDFDDDVGCKLLVETVDEVDMNVTDFDDDEDVCKGLDEISYVPDMDGNIGVLLVALLLDMSTQNDQPDWKSSGTVVASKYDELIPIGVMDSWRPLD
ncbi:hypothetical protein ZIOFF_024658 [Zingiber officinale]|uniref:Glycerol-3-phosphate acyltransferase RAM2/GPAT1-8 HAD-like domain-containing protein n=1 Tax=Zingiber officinale TaxID=94328 RepID=A0A8J5LJ64_ZINOF|nr:hypothetical protein ZIOFF_024658 [Zingiber officinale]